MTQNTFGDETSTISEGGFRTLFNNLPIPCFGYDTEGKILIWNRSFVDLYRFKVTDILNYSITKHVVNPEDRHKHRATVKSVFAGKSFFGLEWQTKRTDGQPLILQVDTFPLKEVDGHVTMGIATCIDITEQRRNEKALLGAAQQWRDTFDAMADSVSIIDTEGRIRRTNLVTARMTGRSLPELLQSSCNELFHEGTHPPENCPFQRMLKSHRSEHQEFHLPVKNRWISETISPILDKKKTVSGAVLVISDISERKNAERALTLEWDRVQQYLDIAEVILVALDRTGKVILINRKGCKILGYEEQELLGRDWFASCVPSHCQDFTRSIFRKIGEGGISSYESYHRHTQFRGGYHRSGETQGPVFTVGKNVCPGTPDLRCRPRTQ